MIFISTISMAGGILVYFFSCLKLRCLLHLSWCLISLFLIFGFLFTALLLPISVVSLEFCGILDEFINTKEGFNKYTEFIGKDVKDKVFVCLFEDG